MLYLKEDFVLQLRAKLKPCEAASTAQRIVVLALFDARDVLPESAYTLCKRLADTVRTRWG